MIRINAAIYYKRKNRKSIPISEFPVRTMK